MRIHPFKVVCFSLWFPLAGVAAAGQVGLVKINGAIGPATSGYIARAIEVAEKRSDSCLVIQLDTPGGLLESTKVIVQSLYASKVPTVVFVAPEGASAGSAGCFITLAADIAAMAPNTSIGAAHPVALGSGGEGGADDTMKKKMENFAASFIESIAQKRQRNVEWARSSVTESASVTASQALALKVIDVVADDVPDLLRRLDGRSVNNRILATRDAEVTEIPMIARERVFQLLWRPEMLFLLALVAIYGILGELGNPGSIFPGVVGGIALVLVLYMSSILPVNIAGLVFLALALVLFIADVFAPTHGVLTTGGIVSLALGSLLLFRGAGPAFHLSLGYIVPGLVITLLFVVFVVGAGLRAQRLPVRAGREAMIGLVTPALDPIGPQAGRVFVEGESWAAVSDEPIEAGRDVRIVSVEGLTLKVKATS